MKHRGYYLYPPSEAEFAEIVNRLMELERKESTSQTSISRHLDSLSKSKDTLTQKPEPNTEMSSDAIPTSTSDSYSWQTTRSVPTQKQDTPTGLSRWEQNIASQIRHLLGLKQSRLMPYIKESSRIRAALEPSTPGELNYAITSIIKAYMNIIGKDYHTFNDILGALEGAKLEFYRRVVVPYEDQKIKENGDVY